MPFCISNTKDSTALRIVNFLFSFSHSNRCVLICVFLMNNAVHHPFPHVRPPVHLPYEPFGHVLASFLVATPVSAVAAPPAFHLREALRLRETGWVHRAHAGVGARTGPHDARLPVACFLTVDFSRKLVKVYKALFFEPSQGTGSLGSGRGDVHLGPL